MDNKNKRIINISCEHVFQLHTPEHWNHCWQGSWRYFASRGSEWSSLWWIRRHIITNTANTVNHAAQKQTSIIRFNKFFYAFRV